VFQIHDSEGQLVAYAGRSIDGSEPRYLFPPSFRKSQVRARSPAELVEFGSAAGEPVRDETLQSADRNRLIDAAAAAGA